jgi:hypothetical protein
VSAPWVAPDQPVDNPLPPVVVSPWARSYARRHATAHMYYTVAITRMVAGAFDEATGGITSQIGVAVYQGPARIWTVAGPMVISSGEDQMSFSQTNMSIPWDTDPVPRRDDIASVLDYQLRDGFGDPALLGRHFRILDVQLGGQMYAARRMSVSVVSASSAWGEDSLR